MELKERIAQVRKVYKLTQKEFGERIGVAANTVTNYESGNRSPIDAVLVSICREFGVSEEWLRTGEGDMIPTTTEEEMLAGLFGQTIMTDGPKKRIVSAALKMTEEECKLIESLIEKLYNSKNTK